MKELLEKFMISETDIKCVRDIGPLIMAEIDEHLDEFYSWLGNNPEYDQFFADRGDRLARVRRLQVENWEAFFCADLDAEWMEARRHVGAVHAYINLPNAIYFAAISVTAKSFTDRIKRLHRSQANLEQTTQAITKLLFLDSYLVIEEISRIQREKIEASSKALMEMSTPVTPIWEGILLLPLVGIIDSERTHDIMTKTLNKIAETRSRVFVLDISGVGAMDTGVANQLIKITRATQLMGCETIISGVSPTIARTLVELGISVGEVKTTATLRDSFEMALNSIGVERKKSDDRRPAAI